MLRAACLLGSLLVSAAAFLPSPSLAAKGPGEELAQLAAQLRAQPSPANYQALARFAARYAESELSTQAEFALGMADFEAERWTQARERFRAARASQWLRDHATLQLARAEIRLGALDAARLTLMELSFAASPLHEEARVVEADRQVRAGRAPEAVAWLQRQPDVWHRPALLRALAQAQWAAGELVDAAETLHRIYYEFPLSPEAEPANDLLSRLRAQLNANYPAPSEALRRARAEKLWARQAYRGARSVYVDLSVRASEPTRSEARLRAALALYELGSAAAACGELAKIGSVPPALEAEFRTYRVRCGLRNGIQSAVESDLGVLAAQFPESPWYAEALLAAGNTALARGEAARARAYYQRLVEAAPVGEAAAEAHWKLAWLAYREKDTAAATRLFEEHLERFPQSPFLARALYWRAQAARTAGDASLAERLLVVLKGWAPRDYPAQQAERFTARRRGASAGEAAFPPWLEKVSQRVTTRGNDSSLARATDLPPAVRAEAEKAAVLVRLSFPELAAETLAAAVQRWPYPELYLAQARLAFADEDYARATEILRRAYPTYWRLRLEELPREAWEIMFPRPYWDLIRREARRQGLDPYLVAALIRQESRFEREAVSSAGALGLMQLMPETARRLAGVRRLSPSRIQEPEFNVRLGTRYLGELLRGFDGDRERAVAGYNAGASRVEEWASQGPFREPAEFVESIPVTQTREFVYTVLRNYRFYHDLYASSEAASDLATSQPSE